MYVSQVANIFFQFSSNKLDFIPCFLCLCNEKTIIAYIGKRLKKLTGYVFKVY